MNDKEKLFIWSVIILAACLTIGVWSANRPKVITKTKTVYPSFEYEIGETVYVNKCWGWGSDSSRAWRKSEILAKVDDSRYGDEYLIKWGNDTKSVSEECIAKMEKS